MSDRIVDYYAVPIVLAALLVGGHLVDIIADRDDWPFSGYAMYARPLGDASATSFVISAVFADGTADLLTTTPEHPLLVPLNRAEAVWRLALACSRREDVGPAVRDLARWVQYRAEGLQLATPVVRLDVHLYMFYRFSDAPFGNQPPDAKVLIDSVDFSTL